MAGIPIGLDFGAIMPIGAAQDADLELLADTLPDFEAVVIAACLATTRRRGILLMAVGRPQVSIRLGTTGRSDVEKDFAAIGDSGEAQAKRYQASLGTRVCEAERRAGKASQGRRAPGRCSADVQRGDQHGQPDHRRQLCASPTAAPPSVGRRDHHTAGRRPKRRRASGCWRPVDPLYAAQMRYDQALPKRIAAARALTTDQLAVVQTGLKKELDDTTALYGKHGTPSATRASRRWN
jgi:hypothetical protein